MASSTVYDVKMRFAMEDHAERGARSLHDELRNARKEGNMLSEALREVGTVAAEFLGAREGYRALIGYNDQLEQMKISMSAIMKLQMGGSMEKNAAISENLIKEFQAFSKTTTVTTKDVMEFGTGISSSVFQAGGSMKEFVNVTEMGVVAAKVFGQEAGYAATELEEMMAGTVSKRMRFANQLLAGAHVTEEQFRAMNARQRLDTIKSVLNSKAMREAATAQAGSFAGVTSTLKDNLEVLLQKVGLPLFKAITTEIQRWNEWIDKNGVKLERMAHSFAEGFLAVFRGIKEIISWIVDHSGMVGALLVGLAGRKIAGGIGGAVLGRVTGGGWGGAADNAAGGEAQAMGMMASKINLVVTGLTAFYVGLSAATDYMVEDAARARESSGAAGLELGYAQRYGSGDKSYRNRLAAGATDAGALSVDAATGAYSINYAKLKAHFGLENIDSQNAMTAMDHMRQFGMTVAASEYAYRRTIDAINELGGAGSLAAQQWRGPNLQRALMESLDNLNEGRAAAIARVTALKEPGKVNVTIQKIEVVSDDPDRFVFGMVESFRDAVKNPSGVGGLSRFREG